MIRCNTTNQVPDYLNNIASVKETAADYTSYIMNCSEGTGNLTVYPVLPGIHLIFSEYNACASSNWIPSQHNIIEINHCLEGRLECKLQDNCLLYMGPGDLFITQMSNMADTLEFPLKYYRGITLVIEVGEADEKLPLILKDINLNLAGIFNKLFIGDPCFLIQAKEAVSHIFLDMYTIPEAAKNSYCKLKIWELFIYLAFLDVTGEEQHKFYYQQQVDLIKQVQKQLTANLHQRFTIGELSQQYGISASSLKTHFKGVYGSSISNYMKAYRMKQACSLLLHTDNGIADVAASVGYTSQSKFTAAFKELIGISPLEYRKKLLTITQGLTDDVRVPIDR